MNILDIRTYSNESASFVQIDLSTKDYMSRRAFELLMKAFEVIGNREIERVFDSLTAMIHNHKLKYSLEVIQFQMMLVKDEKTGKNIIESSQNLFLTTDLKKPSMIKFRKKQSAIDIPDISEDDILKTSHLF